MAGKRNPPLRWSVEMASREFGKHPRTIKQALVEANIAPGADGNYSSQQILIAVAGDDKEREARAAKNQLVIDEAAIMHNELDLQEGRLVLLSHFGEALADIMTQLVQFVRQSKLSNREKKDAMKILREVKLNPRKIVEFQQ